MSDFINLKDFTSRLADNYLVRKKDIMQIWTFSDEDTERYVLAVQLMSGKILKLTFEDGNDINLLLTELNN